MKKSAIIVVAGLIFPFVIGCNNGNVSEPEPVYHYRIENGPNKTIYLTNQNFDPTGIRVTRTREGYDCIDLYDEVEVLDGENLQLGTEQVTIKVEDFTAKIDIEVKETYKVVCCGDSLTKGHYWQNEAYPNYINDYANHTFNVVNCGENGISITGYGGSWNDPAKRYQLSEFYRNSLDADPDVVLLFLGTNDATGWADAEPLFEDQYRELIDAYINQIGDEVKFIMVVSPPTEDGNQFGIPNDKIRDYVNPIQRQLADDYGMELIDLREQFESRDGGFADFIRPGDGVHLSKLGAQYVAEQIANVLEII